MRIDTQCQQQGIERHLHYPGRGEGIAHFSVGHAYHVDALRQALKNGRDRTAHASLLRRYFILRKWQSESSGTLAKTPAWRQKDNRGRRYFCPLLTQGGHVGHGKRWTVKELPITTRGHSEHANWHPARPGSHPEASSRRPASASLTTGRHTL